MVRNLNVLVTLACVCVLVLVRVRVVVVLMRWISDELKFGEQQERGTGRSSESEDASMYIMFMHLYILLVHSLLNLICTVPHTHIRFKALYNKGHKAIIEYAYSGI